MASLTRTIHRHIKWTKPNSDRADKDVHVKQKMDRKDIVKEDADV